MKKYVYILIALLLSACNQSDSDNSVLLNIRATGEIDLVPDMASVTVNISCIYKDIAASNECARKNIDTLFALFDKHKISKDDYHSSRVNLEKSYSWRNNSNIFDGYRSSSTIGVEFKDIEVMGQVITKMMGMKNAEVSGLNYSHSKIDALTNDAYLKALGNAGKLAEDFRQELKGESVRVLEVSNIDNKFRTSVSKGFLKREAVSNFSDAAPAIQINPGMLKLVKDVYVLYSVEFTDKKK